MLTTTVLLSGVGTAKANLIVNGGFETGDFTGWIVNADIFNTSVIGNSPPDTFAGFQSKSGTHFAALGDSGTPGTLSQTVTTVLGQVYTLSMHLGIDGLDNHFKVDWNGTPLFDQTNISNITPSGETPFRYLPLSFTVQGTGSDVLTFSETASGYLALDDVNIEISSVPEPSSLLLMPIAGLVCFGRRRLKSRRVCECSIRR